MTQTNPGFVLIHGAWHDHHIWDAVLLQLQTQGYVAEAFDLPSAGANAGSPASFSQRPLDPAAFATEPSPNASVTQDDRNAALLSKIDEVAARTGGKVVVVAHSLGGITLTPVTEEHPEKVAAAVYLAGSVLHTGESVFAISQTPSMVDTQSALLLMADPGVVGAMRMDVASTDAEYKARLKSVFYGDLDDVTFEQVRTHLHPDEPIGVFAAPSDISTKRFGSVPRHYIRCTEDRNIPLIAQDQMIARVDEEMGSKTQLHTLHTSHSPFYSDPQAVTDSSGRDRQTIRLNTAYVFDHNQAEQNLRWRKK